MIKVRAPRRLVSEINVVPYIDVMLVLLVVFMITAPMMTQGIQVELPKNNDQPLSVEEPVIVTLRKDGHYYINIGKDERQSKDLETIKGHALKIIKNNPEALFLVEGDTAVSYGKVMALMSALQKAGVSKLGLVTEPLGN